MDNNKNTYLIGQLATLLGVSNRTIRYYEELGFFSPSRTVGGYRTYSKTDADLLRLVLDFKDLGMTLDEIRGLVHPTDGKLDHHVMAELKNSLISKRNEFAIKIERYRASMKLIDNVLQVLSKSEDCGDGCEKPAGCESCLMERKQKGEDITPLISSLLQGENIDESEIKGR